MSKHHDHCWHDRLGDKMHLVVFDSVVYSDFCLLRSEGVQHVLQQLNLFVQKRHFWHIVFA